jgi:hypothetical protein
VSPLVVHLNGRDLYDVAPAADVHETDGSFDVEFRNHGQPVHVHLRLDEALSRVASVDGQNHYLEDGSALRVPVTVADDAPSVEGVLTVVTGYGKGAEEVAVSVGESGEGPAVDVDERLDRPEADAPDAGDGTGIASGLPLDRSRLPDVQPRAAVGLVALVVVAVGAAAVAAVAAPGLAVVAGIFAVLGGIGVAGYLLVA